MRTFFLVPEERDARTDTGNKKQDQNKVRIPRYLEKGECREDAADCDGGEQCPDRIDGSLRLFLGILRDKTHTHYKADSNNREI